MSFGITGPVLVQIRFFFWASSQTDFGPVSQIKPVLKLLLPVTWLFCAFSMSSTQLLDWLPVATEPRLPYLIPINASAFCLQWFQSLPLLVSLLVLMVVCHCSTMTSPSEFLCHLLELLSQSVWVLLVSSYLLVSWSFVWLRITVCLLLPSSYSSPTAHLTSGPLPQCHYRSTRWHPEGGHDLESLMFPLSHMVMMCSH